MYSIIFRDFLFSCFALFSLHFSLSSRFEERTDVSSYEGRGERMSDSTKILIKTWRLNASDNLEFYESGFASEETFGIGPQMPPEGGRLESQLPSGATMAIRIRQGRIVPE